jgi:hypothetical protein
MARIGTVGQAGEDGLSGRDVVFTPGGGTGRR